MIRVEIYPPNVLLTIQGKQLVALHRGMFCEFDSG